MEMELLLVALCMIQGNFPFLLYHCISTAASPQSMRCTIIHDQDEAQKFASMLSLPGSMFASFSLVRIPEGHRGQGASGLISACFEVPPQKQIL